MGQRYSQLITGTVAILGDSTSMTVGLKRQTYPFLLADMPQWPAGTEFVNCSQPGFTAADAAAFFCREASGRRDLRAVIIYLGNCDANASELKKGRYTVGRDAVLRLKHFLGISYRSFALKNKLLRYEWNERWDSRVEGPEPASAYESNIRRILVDCRRRKVPVALVKPQANRLFPAGIGKGNFIFYSFLDFPDNIIDELQISDGRFLEALRLERRGEYGRAMEHYRLILEEPGPSGAHPEFPLVVVNNYAVCASRFGRRVEAEKLWRLLLKERGIRREIVLYNLGCLQRSLGDGEKAAGLFSEAYEADTSLYRIKNEYLHALERLADDFREIVSIVDMAAFTDDCSFIDHCHLLPEGQRELSSRIAGVLSTKGVLSGTAKARIQNVLYNPELSLGNTQEFYAYYKTYAPYSPEELRRQVVVLREHAFMWGKSDELVVLGVSREIVRAVSYYLQHPCFPSLDDVLRFPPDHPADVGRFPELYLARYLIPYLRMLENDKTLSGCFTPYRDLLHTSDDFLRILPSGLVAVVAPGEPDIDRAYEEGRVARILSCVDRRLNEHLCRGNEINRRLKTTIFWYFRETLRWGPHSRVSMRYDGRFLEYAMEGLALAAVLNQRIEGGCLAKISHMAERVAAIARVHDEFAVRFDLRADHQQLFQEYNRALEKLRVDPQEAFLGAGRHE